MHEFSVNSIEHDDAEIILDSTLAKNSMRVARVLAIQTVIAACDHLKSGLSRLVVMQA